MECRCDRGRSQRRLDGEDRTPVEGLREDAAQGRADCGAQRPCGHPDSHRAPAIAAQDDEQRERDTEEERRADSLGDPAGDKGLQAAGGGTHDGRGEEDDQAGEREAGRANAAHEGQERKGADDHGQVVRGHHPRDARDRRLQLQEELRQGQNDDRRVGEGDGDRDRERDFEQKVLPGFDRLGLDGGSLRADLEPDV
jgi:hypothetical protein